MLIDGYDVAGGGIILKSEQTATEGTIFTNGEQNFRAELFEESLVAMILPKFLCITAMRLNFCTSWAVVSLAKLTNEQLERYSRHIILEQVGGKGQKKILDAKILIIGTGGLGAPAAMYLAAAGVGHIGLVDYDTVDLSNLQRQIIHQTADIGKEKIISGRETINEMNPDVQVHTYDEQITSENIRDIINDQNYDFIIDGTDNFPTKFLINDACVLLKKAYSHAGIIRFQGQTMTYVPDQSPCYRCVFPTMPPKDAVPTCRQAGVLGVMGGVIGTIQATEALKYILGIGELLTGYLLTYDALTMTFRKIRIPRNKKCAVCSDNPTITELVDYEQPTCSFGA